MTTTREVLTAVLLLSLVAGCSDLFFKAQANRSKQIELEKASNEVIIAALDAEALKKQGEAMTKEVQEDLEWRARHHAIRRKHLAKSA